MASPPDTSKGAASFAIVQTDRQAAAINTIMRREGASAARVIVERSRWHKPKDRELEVQLYFAESGWDAERHFLIRASGAWAGLSENYGRMGYQPMWRDPE